MRAADVIVTWNSITATTYVLRTDTSVLGGAASEAREGLYRVSRGNLSHTSRAMNGLGNTLEVVISSTAPVEAKSEALIPPG